jgi:aminoglycoside phosphotransferase
MRNELEACLPVELRGPGTTLVPVRAGLSGAGVYRVMSAGLGAVLKITSPREPLDGWRRSVEVQRAAADAGLAPSVLHVDEARRAVVTERVVDRGFVARVADPGSRTAAVGELGAALRRVHALKIPAGAKSRDPREQLGQTWTSLSGFMLPAWVGDAVTRALDANPPPVAGALVLSHNDVNPSNLVSDGQRVLFLDWDSAGANDPLYDLATVAVFLDLDDASCAQLIAAHDEAPAGERLPVRFLYLRGVIAALCGALFLQVARAGGHPGGTREVAMELGKVHERMRAGVLSARTPDGQWEFGLALLEASTRWLG